MKGFLFSNLSITFYSLDHIPEWQEAQLVRPLRGNNTMKAFLEAFTKCFLYILILTLSNVFDRYVLYFTVGEIRV